MIFSENYVFSKTVLLILSVLKSHPNIDLSNLRGGIYFVRMNGATQKFIKNIS